MISKAVGSRGSIHSPCKHDITVGRNFTPSVASIVHNQECVCVILCIHKAGKMGFGLECWTSFRVHSCRIYFEIVFLLEDLAQIEDLHKCISNGTHRG